tara:strand:- start:212 stop:571 length:360 start_codon:yes stop_codon:yes gene_type:complete
MATPRKKKIIPASRMGDVIDDMGPIPGGPRGKVPRPKTINTSEYRQRRYLIVTKNRKKTRVLGSTNKKDRALSIREALAKKLKIPKSNIRIKDQQGAHKQHKEIRDAVIKAERSPLKEN